MTVFDPDLGGVDRELDALLGAYALHAVDPAERARVDDYLLVNLDARAEVDDHRETAALLALLSDDERVAPPAVWDAIVAAVTTAPGDEPAPGATVVSLVARRSVSARVVGAVGAVAAAVIAILGFQVADLRGRVDDAPPVAAPSVAAQYASAASRDDAAVVVLRTSDARELAHIALLPDGTGYVVNDALDPLPDDRTYQLWAVVGAEQKVISVGVLGNTPGDAAFHVAGPVTAFVLTEEVAGGVPQSEGRSVAVSPVA
ncbi:MAG TPA: anti-sigma factor [Acidimicrobiia bacterium]|nr:anti-sigma factor [Acidimicrobiia bacterium]